MYLKSYYHATKPDTEGPQKNIDTHLSDNHGADHWIDVLTGYLDATTNIHQKAFTANAKPSRHSLRAYLRPS